MVTMWIMSIAAFRPIVSAPGPEGYVSTEWQCSGRNGGAIALRRRPFRR